MPEEKNYQILSLEIPGAQDQIIRGELYLPEPMPSTCVILSNAFMSNFQSSRDRAQGFARAGIAAVIYDFRGGSPTSSSDGSFDQMSVLTERDDLEHVVDWIEKHYDFKKLFLMGMSQGGFVSAMAADRLGDRISGLILHYPALIIPDDARALLEHPETMHPSSPALHAPIGERYRKDAASLDYLEAIRHYGGPVLILHGDHDQIAPMRYSFEAMKAYPDATLVVYPGQAHGFGPEERVDSIERSVRFVQEHS